MQFIVNCITEIRFTEKIFHYIQSLLNRTHILQWKDHPTTKHTATHRGYCAINNIKQRTTIILHCVQKLKRTNGKTIQTYIFLFLNTTKGSNMIDMSVLSNLEILHDSTRSDNTISKVINTKTLQTLCSKMLQEFLACCILCENPVIKFKSTELITKIFLEVIFLCSVKKNLLRCEITKKLLHIIVCSFTSKELTCRNIKKGNTTSCLTKMNSSKEIVLLIVEHIITHRNTRSNKFGNSSLHHLVHLRKTFLSLQLGTFLLRVFQLVADSYSLTSTNEFWQECVESMMRKTSHLSSNRFTSIITSGKRNTKNSRSLYSIITIGFIEVTTTKQHQSIRMLCFKRKKLLHHWCKPFGIYRHISVSFLIFG